MRARRAFSKVGGIFGGMLALTAVISAGLGSYFMGRIIKKEDRAYIQQSIGDTSTLLGGYFRSELDHLIDSVKQGSIPQVRQKIESQPTESQGVFDFSSELIDLALWKKKAQLSAFDLFPEPKRVFYALNSNLISSHSDLIQQLKMNEAVEKPFIQPALQGHTVIAIPPQVSADKNVLLIAIPGSLEAIEDVWVGHFRLDRFQRAVLKESLVSVMLVDEFGNILAHRDASQVGKKLSDHPLYLAMHSSNLTSGQVTYEEKGATYFGGYNRIGVGGVAVLASVAESEATSGFQPYGKFTLSLLTVCFFSFFFIGYGFYSRKGFLFYERRQAPTPVQPNVEETPIHEEPKKAMVTILHGSLKHLNQVIEQESPQSAADTMNDFYAIAESSVKSFGGLFERFSDHSFIGIWGVPQSDGSEIWCGLRSALELRKFFFKLNEARKIDGQKPLSFGMGIHTGYGLAARFGSSQSMKYSVIGEVIHCAKALDQLSHIHGTDLLVSQESWQQSDAKFTGDLLGEAKLTPKTGLMAFYQVNGYRNEQGEAVPVEISPESIQKVEDLRETSSTTLVVQKKSLRWLVNNGSQIVGPFEAAEIASRLFAQELDFDCECWAEGTGNSAQIKNSGIFSGSQDESANLWAYDGQTIHGPVSLGFLKTALGHGAIQLNTHICEESTVNGWKPLSEWEGIGNLPSPPIANPVEPEKSVPQDALRASLAPPQKKAAPTEIELTENTDSVEDPTPSKKAA